jgi:uncharacterized protein YbjT (DUF2867 family)
LRVRDRRASTSTILPPGDGEAQHGETSATDGDDHTGGAVDQRGSNERGLANKITATSARKRLPGDRRRRHGSRPSLRVMGIQSRRRLNVTGGAMTSAILVTGGTGTLGRHVVRRLRDAGCDVRVLSRHNHPPLNDVELKSGDLSTGEGVDDAVAGTEVVVHCAGSAKGDEDKTRNLVRAASRAGVRHLVFISVVGADRVPIVSAIDRAMFGYFGSKLAAEHVVAGSGLPWTTLRATQFHDLHLMVAEQMAKLPVIPVPARFRFQPVDADEVAARLVELAFGTPAGLVPDIAGPRVYSFADLLREYLRARRKHRILVPVLIPGQAARAVRGGANLSPGRAVGHRTWEDFLAERVNPAVKKNALSG